MTAVAGDGVGWSRDDIIVVARDSVAVVWTRSRHHRPMSLRKIFVRFGRGDFDRCAARKKKKVFEI